MFDQTRFYSKAEFKFWLRAMPGDVYFDYGNSRDCLFATWAAECGMEEPSCGPESVNSLNDWSQRYSLRSKRWIKAAGAGILRLIGDRSGSDFTVEEVLELIK